MSLEFNTAIDSLVDEIGPILQHREPDVQGAVIADLFGAYIAGHPREVRENIIVLWLDLVRDLVAMYDDEKFAEKNFKKNKAKSERN